MFKIQVATENEIALIRELANQIWPQAYKNIITKEQIDYMLDLMYSESSLRNQMNDNCCFIIVNDNAKPVGFASYQQLESKIYKLQKLYVLPLVQGKGAGRHMMEYILHDLKNKKGNSIQLQVNRYNNAKKFYEKLGFKIIGEADFDIGNGYFMNDYIMEKVW